MTKTWSWLEITTPTSIGAVPWIITLSIGGVLWWCSSSGRTQVGSIVALRLLSGRFRAVSMSFLSLLLMGGVIAGLNLDTHPTVVGILAAFAFCLREALDPMLPGLWHHRRLRPIASLVIVALAIGFASLLRHPAWTILACAIMIFHRHMAGALRLFNQNLIEVDALATRLRAMDTERLLKQAVYLQTVTAADTQPRAHDALSS